MRIYPAKLSDEEIVEEVRGTSLSSDQRVCAWVKSALDSCSEFIKERHGGG